MNRRPPRNGISVETKENILLIDGNALFKVGLNGAKTQFNSKGKNIGGVFQFMTVLRKMLVEDLYHRVYVFWDGNFSGLMRYNIYEPYKSGRGKNYKDGTQPIDESELEQRKMVWEYLNDLYIRQMKDEVVESDDLIAYFCLKRKHNQKITIVTNDRDYAQLIEEDVRIYFCDRAIKDYVNLNNFSQYFPYYQPNSKLVKILIGDDSDSIKGVKSLGLTTLINLFPRISKDKVILSEIIEDAVKLQEERGGQKQKPLKVLDNIINGITDGVQGKKLYEINQKLIDLSNPMITDKAIQNLNFLIEGSLEDSGREIKNVLRMMERDCFREFISDYKYDEFLEPFKKLISREKSNNLKTEK